ncbi:MAG: methionine--tRNA ligase subunit beta [Phycisphaerales bacterium]
MERDRMAFKDPITYDDFAKIDLRVATIKAAEHHPNADRLLKIQLDDGTDAGRQICAGIRGHYEPEDLVGKQIVIVANLEPRKIRGEISQGMLLAASETSGGGDDAEKRVIVLGLHGEVTPGSSIS